MYNERLHGLQRATIYLQDYLPHSKGSVSSNILRATTNKNSELARFNNVLHPRIPQTNILNQDRNLNSLGRASRNNNLLEALQRAVGNNHRSNVVRDIHLDNLGTIPTFIRVGHIHADGDALVRRRNAAVVDADRAILEGGVALAVAEGIPGKRVAENVLVPEDEGPVAVGVARVTDGAARVQVIVEDWEVADVPGEADRELARGVVVTEKDVSEGIAAFLGGVELLDEGGGRVGEPCVGNGLATGEDDDGRHAGVSDGLDERALRTDQGEVVFVDVFTGAKESMWS